MDREAKTAKAKAGAKLPPVRRSRPRAVPDDRSVEQRLADALAQQAATSEILRVMSASPTDVQPVMEAVAEQAARLCHSPFARVILAEGDLMLPLAHFSVDGEYPIPMNPVPLQRTSITGRAVLDRATVHHADVVPLLETEFPAALGNARLGGMRAVLAVPLMHKGAAYGAIFLWRREPGLFTPDQVALVETFATQAAIAIENVRLFRATQEALEQQTATSEILRVISRSQTNVQPVFETIAANALRLCDARRSAIFRFDGELIHIAALRNLNPQGAEALRNAYPAPPSRGSPSRRAILTGGIVHIVDVRADPEYKHHDVAKAADFRSVLSVPMLRDGQPIGTITVYRDVAKPFPDAQIELLKTFADQAVIAIENVRLFSELEVRNRDLTEALEQQTVTSDILRVISQSQTDAQPVFETIAEAARKLCRASSGHVVTFDGALIHLAALSNLNPGAADALRQIFPRPPSRDIGSTRAVLTGSVVEIPDVLEDREYAVPGAALSAGYRSVLAVPLVREGSPIGAIGIARPESGPFADAQIALLKTFADQAVIAIENVRLFKELEERNRDLTEALEQQTATSDILRVISRSQTDAQPVFETIAANALRLCDAQFSAIFRYDGELIHIGAFQNLDPEGAAAFRTAYPCRPSRGGTTQRAILTGQIVHMPDIHLDAEYVYQDVAKAADYRSVLSVPMLREGRPIGTITVYRDVARPFPDSQIELLKTFADQAVIAIENVRLFTELEVRNRDLTEALEQQTATSDILRVISGSQTDVQPVFDTIAKAALELCSANSANVFTFDGELIHMVPLVNLNPGYVEAMRKVFPRPPGRDTAITRAILTGSIVAIPDVRDDAEYMIAEAALAGGFRSVLAVPLIREGIPIGAIAVGRPEPGPFPDTQIALLQTFADQAVIAIENVRLFSELEMRNRDLTIALDQQTATSEILRVISSAQTDVKPVFDAIVRSAVQLCGAHHSIAARYDGEFLHAIAFHGFSPEALQMAERMFPMRPGPENMLGRAALSKAVVNLPDMLADPTYSHDFAMAGGWRSGLGVPMLRDGEMIGAIAVSRREFGAFPDHLVALLTTFADQAVIAVENVRLFTELEVRNRDLTEALEQQTATSDILRVISQSQTDVQPVFDTIAKAALELCSANSANVFTYDGALVHLASFVNVDPAYIEALRKFYPRPLGRETAVLRAIQAKSVAVIPDVLDDKDYVGVIGSRAAAGRFRSILAVPLMRDGAAIGGIAVGRAEPGTFPDTQVELLKTFADQAVIAIENVRLFKELEIRNRDLTEALEQQTATSDILRVISQSQTDVQPVFDTIAKAAHDLCGAMSANVITYDGELLHLAAFVNEDPAYVEALRGLYPRPLSGDTAVHRAIMTRSVVAIPDVIQDSDYVGALAARSIARGFRSALAVPLMREGIAIGGIAVGRAEAGPFPDTQVSLLQTFADQAVIAIENARLFKELEAQTNALTRSVRELKALGDVGQAVSSTLDLETVLSTIVSRAVQLTGMDGGSIYEYDEAREEFYLHTADCLPGELVEAMRATPMRKGEGVLGLMAMTAEPVQIRDIMDEGAYQSRIREVLLRLGYRSVLAVPLVRDNHLLGGLAVNRKKPGEFDSQVIDLLKTFATQSALAIQNARLFREIEIKSRQLQTASQHKSEFLANMSHELRTPLNAIIGFSEVLSERLFGEMNDKQAEYVGDISESGRHLLNLINDILDLSKIEAGRMELDASDFDIATTIDNTMSLVRERAQRREIALRSTVDPRLGEIRADERKVRQVLLNLLSNAIKFTPEGGAIDVRATACDDRTEISVTDTGVGIAPEDQEAVFEEFRQVGATAKKIEGTGLGLAISRKFIELHGGRIWVTSQPGVGSTFTFALPTISPAPR